MSQTPPEAGGEGPQDHSGQQSPPQQQFQPDAVQTQEPVEDPKQQAKSRPDRPDRPKAPSVIVRYGQMRQLGQFRHNIEPPPRSGTHVVVRTERGVELGKVIACIGKKTCYGCIDGEHLSSYLAANGPGFPFRRDGKILRIANNQDIIDHRHLTGSGREEATFCRQTIREMKLDMRLVTVEHLLGGERIIFYFAAETRVDFRELVRQLASRYRTRIEMRQVGARDEARLVADYERCGMRCCCQQYIKELKPVSMRMAKTQKATLDPSKISGRCGRLMCCLRYEDANYEELRRNLPKRNIYVATDKIVGRVVDTQILTQLVRVQLPDRTFVAIANEDILQRNLPMGEDGAWPKLPPVDPEVAAKLAERDQALPEKAAAETQPAEQKSPGQAPGQAPAKRKKRCRRKPRRDAAGASGQSAQPTASQSAKVQSGAPDAASGKASPDARPAEKKKRRRRRRKKKSAE